MGTKIKNERGMTLVELLAALVLVSLVVVLINTVFVFTQRNADSLSSETDVQANLLLGMKVLTKDIRSTDMDQVVVEKNKLILAGTEYTAKDGRLLKNGQTVAEDITSFETCRPSAEEVYQKGQLACTSIKGEPDKERVIVILEGAPNRAGEKRKLSSIINLKR